MSSNRLPGKVLMDLCGRSMLEVLANRLGQSRGLDRIAVATSTEASDDAIAHFCDRHRIPCIRGPLDDVAARFRQAAGDLGADAFVRVNGDSPLIDPDLVERAVALFRFTGADLVTNVQLRSFPKGQSVEVVDAARFVAALPDFDAAEDREHVTRYFYRRPELFHIVNFTSGAAVGDVQMSVDTAEDLELVRRMMAAMDGAAASLGWRDLVALRGRLLAEAA